MNLILIRGGLDDGVQAGESGAVTARHVRQEAMRRIGQAGYMQAHVRHLATGSGMPQPLRYYKMQVDFVAETLSALDPVPEDYAADHYWPVFPGNV